MNGGEARMAALDLERQLTVLGWLVKRRREGGDWIQFAMNDPVTPERRHLALSVRVMFDQPPDGPAWDVWLVMEDHSSFPPKCAAVVAQLWQILEAESPVVELEVERMMRALDR